MAADYTYLGIQADLYAPPMSAIDPLMPLVQTNTAIDASMQDNAISDGQIDSVSAGKITTGTLQAGQAVYVGDNSLIFDGTNRSIYVSDGTYKVVHIGYAKGFY